MQKWPLAKPNTLYEKSSRDIRETREIPKYNKGNLLQAYS